MKKFCESKNISLVLVDIDAGDCEATGRPPAWLKIPLLYLWVNAFDWLIWMDADTILNPTSTFPVPELIRTAAPEVHLIEGIEDLKPIGWSSAPISCALVLKGRSAWSKQFLKDVWAVPLALNHRNLLTQFPHEQGSVDIVMEKRSNSIRRWLVSENLLVPSPYVVQTGDWAMHAFVAGPWASQQLKEAIKHNFLTNEIVQELVCQGNFQNPQVEQYFISIFQHPFPDMSQAASRGELILNWLAAVGCDLPQCSQ